jgi:hypothetical protein
MINTFNILTIVHKDIIEKIKREEEQKILRKFRYLYLIFFIFACMLIIWTGFPGFLFFVFFPFVIVFNPLFENYKSGFILIKFKEFYLIFLFTCIFSIIIFMFFIL